MSETVDTRVVEAKFDSKQFEKGVDRTVKKLDELKKSLTDATTGKTVAEIGNKVQDATDKASNSLEKLQDRFTSFTGMLKQKLLSGIADEIVGVFFKIKNSFESLVSSMSSAQIGIGMQRYTDILTSVRTLVSAGVNQDKAYDAIERLGTYADQTSYSLDSMVATMSKFKTAGADIDTAARMIEGLSNAAASMGVNAQQAERAYLNLQQAYSKKVMLQNDWISFESLPMVGTQFNQAILDAAEKVGTLKKEKNGTYSTVKKAGTKVKSGKGITAGNLGSMLQYRWFTDEVMEEVFGNTYYFEQIGIDEVNALKAKEKEIREAVKAEAADPAKDIKDIDAEVNKRLQEYFNETNNTKIAAKRAEIEERKKTAQAELDAKKGNAKEYAEAKKLYEETIKNLDKELHDYEAQNTLTAFAYNAFRAGQEARSFTDVLNTLKDTISRGWAKSFELIFGKLDEAAEFFTSLTESNFAEGIYAIGEFRNAVLESWRDSGGRETLLGLLEYMDQIAGSIWTKLGLIKDATAWFNQNFDQEKYNNIAKYDTKAAEEYKESVRKEAENNETSPFEQVAKELGQRLMILGRNIRDFFEKVHKWFTEADSTGTSRLQRISNILEGFGTIFNGAMTAAGMGLEFIGKTYTKFKPVFDQLLLGIEKILTPVFNLFNPEINKGSNAYKDLQNILDNLGKIAEKIADPLAKVVGVLSDIATFFVEMAIGTFTSNLTFFSDAFGLLLELLGFGSAQTDNGKSVAKGIADDITSLGDACKSAFQAVSDFFSSVIADIRTWLGLSNQTTQGGNIFQNISNWWNTDESLQTIKTKISDFVAQVGDWIQHIPENVSKFAINIGDFFKSMFYKKRTISVGPNLTITQWIKTDLLLWIEQAIEDIKTWLADLPNNITKFGIDIGDFFKSIFYTKRTISVGPNLTITQWIKKDFTKDLEKALVDIGDWFKDIPNKIMGLFYQEVETVDKRGNKIKTTIATPLKNWLDKAILDVKNFIKDIPNKLKKLPSLISEFFKGLFYKNEKKTLVLGPNGNKTEIEVMVKTPLKEFLDTLVKAVTDFIKDLPTHIHNAIVGIGDFFKMLWDTLLGNNPDDANANASKTIDDVVQRGIDGSLSNVTTNTFWNKIKAIGSDVWNGILTIFTGNSDKEFNNNWIAGKVKEGIENIGTWADTAWTTASEFVKSLPEKVAGLFKEPEKSDNPEEGTVGSAIHNFIRILGDWITSIPDTLLTFWENAEKEIGALWDNILGWITGSKGSLIPESKLTEAQQKQYDLIARFSIVDAEKYKATKEAEWDKNNPIISNITNFFDHVKEYVVNKVKNLPEDISAGLAAGAGLLQSVLDTATKWIYSDLDAEENKTTVTDENGKEKNSALLENLKSFGETIWNLITTTIPGFIGAGFTWVKDHAEKWYDAIKGLFSGGEGEVEKEANSFGAKVEKVLRTIFKPHTFSKEQFDNISRFSISAAEAYKKETSNPIVNFFKDTVSVVGNVMKDLGPTILDGINKALEWLGGKVNLLTGLFNDAHAQDKKFTDVLAEKVAGPETEDSPFYKAIQNLGETIKNIITKVIPEFVSAAFTEISMQVQDWLPKIFGGGDNTKTEKEIEQGISEQFDEEMYKNIAKYDTNAAEQYKKRFDKQNKTIVDQATESARAAADQLNGIYNENGLVDFEKYVNTYLPGMVYDPNQKSGIFGAIADSAESTTESVKNATNSVESVGGFLGSLKETFANLGENKLLQWIALLGIVALIIHQISNVIDNLMFLDDIIGWNAKWIGIGALLTAVSTIIVTLVGLAATGSTDQLNGIYTMFDKVIEIFSKIGEFITLIVSIKAGTAAFDMLNAFFSWREAKAGAVAAKAANGGSLLGGFLNKLLLVVGVAEAGDILSTGLENVLKNVTQGLQSLSQGVGYIVDIIKNIISVADDIPIAYEKVGEIKKLIHAIRDIFHIGEALKDVNGDEGKGLEVIRKYTDKYGQWYADYIDENGYTRTDTWETIENRVAYVDTRVKDTTDEFVMIIRTFSKLNGVLAEFNNALTVDKSKNTLTSDIQTLVGMTEEMKTFGEFASTDDFKNFESALASLGAALSLYSLGIDDFSFDDTTISNAVDLLSMLFGNEELQSLVSVLSGSSLPEGNETLEKAERMVIFAGALASIAKACQQLDENSGENIKKLFETVSTITITDKEGNKISDLAVQFGELGNSISTFAFYTTDLNATNIDNAQTALDMLLRLATGLKEIPNNSALAKIFTGDKTVESFGLGIAALGEDLKVFFDNIENIQNGVSTTYNRSNLQMAILATQGIAESVYILAKSPHINAFDHSAQGGLFNYLGDLGKLAEGIMTFINTVNGYTDTAKYGVINYDFVFNAIEAIEKIAISIDKVPNKYNKNDMGGRIDTLGKILFGDKENGGKESDGFLGQLNEFLGKVVGMSNQGEYEIKLSDAAAIVQSYSDMVAEIMMILLKFGNINYEDFVASYYNSSSPAANLEKKENNIFDILLPSFQNINDNFSTYETFLNNASQYNKLGLDNAVSFFEGLSNLASALYTFSQKDEATGEYNTTKGLTKLMEFNWESFRSVISDMNNVFAEEGLDVSPKITPVFELSDDFKSKVAEMRRELGIQVGENGEWISPDLKVTISAEGLPELGSIDKKLDTLETISKALETLQASVDGFDNSLSSMRFIINGEELSLAIAPSIDKALGLETFIGARGVITSGGFVNESGP